MKKLSDLLDKKNYGSKTFYRHSKTQADKGNVFDFLSLIKNWHTIVGPKLAESTIPLKFIKDTLVILTKHSAYSQHLDYMSGIILEKTIEKYPILAKKVKKIRFQVSHKQFEFQIKANKNNGVYHQQSTLSEQENSHRFSPDYIEKKKKALKEFAHIEDEEVKELLVSMRLQSLLVNKPQSSPDPLT